MSLSQKWTSFKQKLGMGKPSAQDAHKSSKADQDPYENLSEIAAPPPVQNEDENASVYAHRTLEQQPRG